MYCDTFMQLPIKKKFKRMTDDAKHIAITILNNKIHKMWPNIVCNFVAMFGQVQTHKQTNKQTKKNCPKWNRQLIYCIKFSFEVYQRAYARPGRKTLFHFKHEHRAHKPLHNFCCCFGTKCSNNKKKLNMVIFEAQPNQNRQTDRQRKRASARGHLSTFYSWRSLFYTLLLLFFFFFLFISYSFLLLCIFVFYTAKEVQLESNGQYRTLMHFCVSDSVSKREQHFYVRNRHFECEVKQWATFFGENLFWEQTKNKNLWNLNWRCVEFIRHCFRTGRNSASNDNFSILFSNNAFYTHSD